MAKLELVGTSPKQRILPPVSKPASGMREFLRKKKSMEPLYNSKDIFLYYSVSPPL